MTGTDALLSRLRGAVPELDAAVERIGEADYGCEERPEDAPPTVWVLALLRDGAQRSLEIPESRLTAHGLTEGSLCRLTDLEAEEARAGEPFFTKERK